MRTRYLAAIFAGGAAQAAREEPRIAACLPDAFAPVLVQDGVLVFSAGETGCLIQPSGAIIGELFERGRTCPAEMLSAGAWAAIDQSGGGVLIEAYWGAYVAILVDDDSVCVVRAPFGDLGCYYVRTHDALIVASDLTLLLPWVERRIDAAMLARHIAYPEWRSGRTCLEGVHELRGGDRLRTIAGDISVETLWSPWRFASDAVRIDNADDAARRVVDAVRLAVTARVHQSERCLLLLSGGLDSAVIAAVLAKAGVAFSCLNLVADDAASDERDYAQQVTRMLGVDLEIRPFELGVVDVHRSHAAHLPYPVHRCFLQAVDPVASAIAAGRGAGLVIDGGGGDNVFFASRSVTALADCLLTGGFDARFWTTAQALTDLAQVGTARLAWKATSRAWLRPRPPHLAPNTTFLSRAAKAEIAVGWRHPWFDPPAGILPGRASHVALLAPAQNLVEAINAQALFPSISPLASQPVVEACLRVPSWLWISPGRNRAIVRDAFAAALPRAIVERRSKGSPASFVATVFERDRTEIRTMLLDGVLAELGIIDRESVFRAFEDVGPPRDFSFALLMGLIDAEAWARAQCSPRTGIGR